MALVATAAGTVSYLRGRRSAGGAAVLVAFAAVVGLWGQSGASSYLLEALLIGCRIPLGVATGYFVAMRLNDKDRPSDDDGTSVPH